MAEGGESAEDKYRGRGAVASGGGPRGRRRERSLSRRGLYPRTLRVGRGSFEPRAAWGRRRFVGDRDLVAGRL